MAANNSIKWKELKFNLLNLSFFFKQLNLKVTVFIDLKIFRPKINK